MRIEVTVHQKQETPLQEFPQYVNYQAAEGFVAEAEQAWDGWVSVEDELPQQPGRYLVCTDTPDDLPFVMRWHRGRGWYAPEVTLDGGTYPFRNFEKGVLFWRELPKGKVVPQSVDSPAK